MSEANPAPANAPRANGEAAPNLPDREWETSPMYLALSSRLAKTESTLASLSAQVATLSSVVKTLSNHAGPTIPGASSTARPPPVFSPFEGPDPAKSSPFIPATTPSAAEPGVAALTTQLAALSASVAQLQRLQTSQSHLSRQNTQTPTPTQERPHHFGRLDSVNTPSHLGNGGPLTGGLAGPGGLVSPAITGSSAFASSRPGINRSMSSSMAQAQAQAHADGADKWGKFGNGATWSPGPGVTGPMTPGGINGVGSGSAATPSAGGQAGATAPGAGFTISKWEHLALKPELLRSINKYG